MGAPTTFNDLGTHRLISFDIEGDVIPHTINSNWTSALGTEPSITVNSVECLAQAAQEGLGIITLSHDSSLIEKYKLLRILPDIQGPSLKAYYVYPTSIKNLKKVQWFGNYLKKAFINYSSIKDLHPLFLKSDFNLDNYHFYILSNHLKYNNLTIWQKYPNSKRVDRITGA